MVVRQCEVYWMSLEDPAGTGSPRPYVILQNNAFNSTGIGTVVVCSYTSNLQRARDFENVMVKKGEAGFPKDCVVNISQIHTVSVTSLDEKLGHFTPARFKDILRGVKLLIEPREPF
ncbi:MAG: type II toxin-antitoxin system PemK/MazF family toxin [Planctomycetota bacterium]